MSKKQTTREIMDKIYAMTPEEVNKFLAWNFERMCKSKTGTDPDTIHDAAKHYQGLK